MSDLLQQVRDEIAQLAATRADTVSALGAATSALEERVQTARQYGGAGDDAGASTAEADAEELRQERRSLLGDLGVLDQSVRDTIEKLLDGGLDPCDAESDVPIVLLPLRIETRYSTDGAVLRVRAYPDDAHVDRLDAGLSAGERQAGVQYWNAVWAGGAAGEDAAWSALVTGVHPRRAAWVAFSLTPTNLSDRSDLPAGGTAPAFPDVPERTNHAPVARPLPDRFTVVARQGALESRAVGAPIAPEVVVGLPRDDDPSALVTVDGAPLGPGMTWMVDYDAAIQIGLAVDVQLAAPGQPVDSLFVFGLRASVDPDTSSGELRGLFASHRFADGAAFVTQGTPTNNTDTDRAAWTRHPVPVPPPTTAGAQQAEAGTNAAIAADALGIASDVFAGLSGATASEQASAAVAHAALWEPTWGVFLERLQVHNPDLALDDVQREAVRDVFTSYVRGRGPLPALRLGNQPYGLLPVSSVDRRWVPDPGDAVESGLLAMLRHIRALWRGGIGDVPTIPSAAAIDDALLEILGSGPQLLGLRVRSIASQSASVIVPPLLGIRDDDAGLQQVLDAIVWRSLGLPEGFDGLGGSLGKTTRPLGLPLVDDTDRDFVAALLSDAPRTVRSVLQALLELALDRARRAVDAATPAEMSGSVVSTGLPAAGEMGERVRELAALVQVGEAKAPDLHAAADALVARVGAAGPSLLAASQAIAGLRTSLADVAFQAGVDPTARPSLALQSVQAWFRAHARLAELRDALVALAECSTPDRRIAVAEALDCASHRLDAWTTALPARRLVRMRSVRPHGVLVGAYGWVENLRPGASTTRDGGYLLAPSLGHAATAGVLRSAYLHHNPGPDGDGAFAIDLTSARVRDGLELLGGIRSGQPLGALLGMRFERRLNETAGTVNRFVLSLRALAPLVGQRLTDRAEAPPAAAKEAIAAANVVDGIRLLALRGLPGSDQERGIRTSLAERPKNPYLPADPPWTGPDDDEWKAITDAMDEIAALCDAAADLLLAEAVHQLVQGHTSGVAATLDAASGGDAIVADPTVTRIPARGTAVTHRLMVLQRQPASGAGGWNVSAPRARAEPRLEAWAEGVLGPADGVVVQVAGNGDVVHLDGAGLCALDVVYDAAILGALEQRLRAALPGLEASPLATRADGSWPRGLRPIGEVAALGASLQRVLASAEPALPSTFARAGEQATRVVTSASLDGLLQRLTAAATTLQTRVDALAGALAAEPVDPDAVASSAMALTAYGIPVPGAPDDVNTAGQACSEGVRRLDAYVAATPADAASAIAAAKLLFGDAFWALPVVSAPGPDLFSARFEQIRPPSSQIRRFLRDHASVRKNLTNYCETLLFCDALEVERTLHLAQLAVAGTAGTEGWLGAPFVANQASPTAPVTDVLVETADTLDPAGPVAGLLVDEWIEVFPMRVELPGTDGTTTTETLVTAGLAANVDVPNARAPQAILLAVPPDGARWTTDAIVDVLTETLELAKLRAVTLERAPWAGRVLPALHEQSWSLQGEETLDIRRIATTLGRAESMIQFVKDAP